LPTLKWLGDEAPRPQILHRGDPIPRDHATPDLSDNAAFARQSRVKGRHGSSAAHRGAEKPPAFSPHHDPIHLHVQLLLLLWPPSEILAKPREASRESTAITALATR
jgi:hypothetical protein